MPYVLADMAFSELARILVQLLLWGVVLAVLWIAARRIPIAVLRVLAEGLIALVAVCVALWFLVRLAGDPTIPYLGG